jgi:hypothetical protein
MYIIPKKIMLSPKPNSRFHPRAEAALPSRPIQEAWLERETRLTDEAARHAETGAWPT